MSTVDPGDAPPPVVKYRAALGICLPLPLLGVISILLYGFAQPGPERAGAIGFGLILAMSAAASSALLGFLFGIPRSVQQLDNGEQAATRRYNTNTNLEQISDWLTKILVGVGLVELGRLPGAVTRLADALAPGLGEAAAATRFTGALLVSSAAWGFFVGYVGTRTFLTTTFDQVDRILTQNVGVPLERAAENLPLLTSVDEIEEIRTLDGPRPTENREVVGTPVAVETSEIRDLVVLRSRAVTCLAQILAPADADKYEDGGEMVRALRHRGVLDDSTSAALLDLFELADQEANGASVSRNATRLVRDLGRTVVQHLSLLGRTAPQRFENHVISALQSELAGRYDVRLDVAVDRVRGIVTDAPATARVDMAVASGAAVVLVEVRARALARDADQLDAIRELIRALPPIPLVLVLPSLDGLGLRDVEGLRGLALGPIAIVPWDVESRRVIRTIVDQLRR